MASPKKRRYSLAQIESAALEAWWAGCARASACADGDEVVRFLQNRSAVAGVAGNNDGALNGPSWLESLECPDTIPGDIDGDGLVGFNDLLLLLSAWGDCVDCGNCPADLDGDCVIGFNDLLLVLANWTA